MPPPSKRRYEPGRRDRIIDVALDVIAKHGVAGTTHRRIAEAADVPLGAMTYYFAGIDPLIHEAFSRLAHTLSAQMHERLSAATNADEARAALLDLVCHEVWSCERNLVLVFELSAFAAREPSARPLLQAWMGVTEAHLQQHFSPTAAKLLDAFLDGILLRNLLQPGHFSREEIAEVIRKLST
jgi:DNA-binding transcriptional regulator YbjK